MFQGIARCCVFRVRTASHIPVLYSKSEPEKYIEGADVTDIIEEWPRTVELIELSFHSKLIQVCLVCSASDNVLCRMSRTNYAGSGSIEPNASVLDMAIFRPQGVYQGKFDGCTFETCMVQVYHLKRGGIFREQCCRVGVVIAIITIQIYLDNR